jgi:hypothetical protein
LKTQDYLERSASHIRIWDSGGYETNLYGEYGDRDDWRSDYPWDENLYVETAKTISWNGKDILVSFDSNSATDSIQGQIENAIRLYEQIPGDYLRDILLHFDSFPDPKTVANSIKPFVSEFHILGLTEKEIAPTWVHGARFIKALKQEMLNIGIDDRLPLHVFGCLDPKSIVHFSLAGAHIFDGLSWLRHFFSSNTTFYRREFEFSVSPLSLLRSPTNLGYSLLANNIGNLEKLTADLAYAIAVNDFELFKAEQAAVFEVLDLAELEG